MRLLFLVLVILLLSACATVPSNVDSQALVVRETLLRNLTGWEIKGRVLVDDSVQAGSARIQWRQVNDQFRLLILPPIAQNTIVLQGNSKLVEARLANGQVLQAPTAEVLLQKYIGWDVPVSQLRYWILGLVDHPKQIVQDSNTGLLTAFVADGWQVEYALYKEVDNIILPVRMNLQHQDVKIRLVVDSWELRAPLPKVSNPLLVRKKTYVALHL